MKMHKAKSVCYMPAAAESLDRGIVAFSHWHISTGQGIANRKSDLDRT